MTKPDIGIKPDAEGRYHWNEDGTGPQPSPEWVEWRIETHWAHGLEHMRPDMTPAELRRVGLSHLIPAFWADIIASGRDWWEG